jgi:uncharacterized membrane protein
VSLAGTGVVAIWHDLLPEAKPEFYQWHNREHMPERVAIPGFRRGRRYLAVEGEPEYFNLYEAANAELLGGADYLNRLNTPTNWTRKVVASFRNVSRSVCRVIYSDGVGQGGFMLTQRFDVISDQAQRVFESLSQRVLPEAVEAIGVSGAHLCVADQAVSHVATVEKQARADATLVPGVVVLIEGVSIMHLKTVATNVSAALQAAGWTGALATSVYQLEHSCDKAS